MSMVTPAPDVVRRVTTPRRIGIAGITLALFGYWLVLPPVAADNISLPIVFGFVAATCGLWAITRGERKIGWGAEVAALGCIVLGIAATISSEAHLDAAVDWGALIFLMFVYATPLTYAAVGGMFNERSGVINIGIEGMMLAGAFFGILAADKLGSWEVGVVAAMAAGAVMGLILAFFAVQLRIDQIVVGTALWFLGIGVTGYLYIKIYGADGTPGTGIPAIPNVELSFLKDIPTERVGNFLYNAIGHMNLMTWLMFVLLIVSYFVMFRSPIGLRLRACGEHPRAADTVGISVYRTRYAALMVSGALAALGGAFLSIGYVHSFTENMTGGRGFIALAAMIFGNWRPLGLFAAALLFGSATALAPFLQVYGYQVGVLVQALPFLLVLIAVSGFIRRPIGPAAVGRPYTKQ